MTVRLDYDSSIEGCISTNASLPTALVGGVYYVRVPAWSGRLELYDPRGKSPLRDLDDPLSPPLPPFHRVRAVLPEEGMLLITALTLFVQDI